MKSVRQEIDVAPSIEKIKDSSDFMSFSEAAIWASNYLNRKISVSNISYLIQYGRLTKHTDNGSPKININELKKYYDSYDREKTWTEKLGKDINWHLSFSQYREKDTTKHVHRLHPYKGKFIPQLVEYFLDSKTDEFKQRPYFKRGDIIIDPFCGSGTTLVQANETGIHAIGVDISSFNAMISNVKLEKYDLKNLERQIEKITSKLKEFQSNRVNIPFEKELHETLSELNNTYFPGSSYRRKIYAGEIDEKEYTTDKEKQAGELFNNLLAKYKLNIHQSDQSSFINKWYVLPVKEEIDFVFEQIKLIQDTKIKKIMAVILSRTMRSCRATTHADLGTLKNPVMSPYYCKKHGKICRPLFSISGWWGRYSIDTLKRLSEFDRLRTDTTQFCLAGDSKNIDILEQVKQKNHAFGEYLQHEKVKGIFSSPPYVGMIDYHEQHAYAYELLGFDRKDSLEIGPLYSGQGVAARKSYADGVSQCLLNCKPLLQEDYDIFLVANDKYNLYPEIVSKAGMRIVNKFKRPVLNRVEKDRGNAYSEIIFHIKEDL